MHWYFWLSAMIWWDQAGQHTQRVPQAGPHTGCVHMANATLVLRLHKHSQPHVPEGLHCHLQDNVEHYNRWQEQFPTSQTTNNYRFLYWFDPFILSQAPVQRTDAHFAKQTSSTVRWCVAFISDHSFVKNKYSHQTYHLLLRWYIQIYSHNNAGGKTAETLTIPLS